MSALLRPATEDDAAGVLAIYAPVVRDSAITFELEPPSEAEVRDRIRETLARWPWLVCEAPAGAGAGRVTSRELLGYAYATTHRSRAAYQWCVEVSVYVHAAARRTGVGRALYGALFEILRQQGFVNAYAGITLPNQASVSLHESLGFSPVGVYRNVGFKLGRWHDVGWWQLALLPHQPPAGAPLSYAAVRESAAHRAALARQTRVAEPRA